MSKTQIGYDGEPPSFSPKRGSEVRDRLTGAIIREGEMSEQNDNVDRLQWLHKHGPLDRRIDQTQLDAGRTLQRDAELAELRGYVCMDGGRSGGGTNRLSDVKLDAMRRHGDAHQWVGNVNSLILRLIVEENKSLEKAAALMRESAKGMNLALRGALDALSRFYDHTGWGAK